MVSEKENKSTQNQLVIIDCDGVLYPQKQLPTRSIKVALDKTRLQLGISQNEADHAGKEAKKSGHLGMFNYILFMCRHVGLPSDIFYKRLISNLDYSSIKPDPELLKELKDFSKDFPVCVFTNNHALHLANILDRRFGAYETNFIIPNLPKRKESPYGENPIPCYDITSTFTGHSYKPKQAKNGFKKFCKARDVQMQNAILLDDTPQIIGIAQNAGMQTRLICPQHPLITRLAELRVHLTKTRI